MTLNTDGKKYTHNKSTWKSDLKPGRVFGPDLEDGEAILDEALKDKKLQAEVISRVSERFKNAKVFQNSDK